jgi:hypothetical protein
MGATFARLYSCGLFVFGYGEYPSLIRGGHNTAGVRGLWTVVPSASHLLRSTKFDRLNPDKNGIVIYDERVWRGTKALRSNLRLCLRSHHQDLGGSRHENTVALGASLAVFGFEFSHGRCCNACLGARVLTWWLTTRCRKGGYDYVMANTPWLPTCGRRCGTFEKKCMRCRMPQTHLLTGMMLWHWVHSRQA